VLIDRVPLPRVRPRRAQRLLVFATALALVAVAVAGALVSRASSRILVAGHGEHLLHEIRELHPIGRPFDAAEAAGLVSRFADDGLRCVAIFDADGRPLARGGRCAASDDLLAWAATHLPPDGVLPSGPRALAVHRPPPPLADAPAPADPTFPHRWPIVVEYDPLPAHALHAVAGAILVIGLLGAALLVGSAVLNDRLARRAAALDGALARDRHLASLGEMSAVLAHEIRNPLASLKGNAQLLAERVAGDRPVHDRAQLLVRETERLEALCEQLLAFARAHRVEPADTDPAALLRDAAASVDGDRVVVETDGAPRSWRLDPLRMGQALANLLHNAVQASPPGSVAHAAVRRDGDALVVEVRDAGPGVPPAERERIFEPFHTTRVRGTGLGLAVARRIVELHGGTIDVGDAPGGGALFRVRVPGA
jgi:two-component system sensor histidine kinase HydH